MSGRRLGPGRHGLADLSVGDVIETARQVVGVETIDAFAALTGDRFEIHMTAEGARRHGFSDRVAHGLLVLSMVDGLKNRAAAQFDAIASLGWDWTFAAPVLAGDSIAARITVTALRATSDGRRGIATLEFEVTNQRGETVQRGVNRLMIHA
ncbi:MaoC family dehydratase [Oceaniglobus roseus]|uniref:MaoC family dehydratase n=1 Tax=Oceaniglobus roseus TaxID=1737570 RepID=UPI000C7EBBC7|nr:MaoC/PaaZ C-terminal domain-containing protein [Kandeliimicrobium roseum]